METDCRLRATNQSSADGPVYRLHRSPLIGLSQTADSSGSHQPADRFVQRQDTWPGAKLHPHTHRQTEINRIQRLDQSSCQQSPTTE